jgi:hypothetical protein
VRELSRRSAGTPLLSSAPLHIAFQTSSHYLFRAPSGGYAGEGFTTLGPMYFWQCTLHAQPESCVLGSTHDRCVHAQLVVPLVHAELDVRIVRRRARAVVIPESLAADKRRIHIRLLLGIHIKCSRISYANRLPYRPNSTAYQHLGSRTSCSLEQRPKMQELLRTPAWDGEPADGNARAIIELSGVEPQRDGNA